MSDNAPSFPIPPFARITIDSKEMLLLEDGVNGKVFEPLDKSGRPDFYSNKDILSMLHHGSLEIHKDRYNPKKLRLTERFPFLRDLSGKTQTEVRFKLEWIMRFRAKGGREGKIPEDRMKAIMREIRDEFERDLTVARQNSNKKAAYTYEDGEFHLRNVGMSTLRTWHRDYTRSGDDWRVLIDGRGSGERKSMFTDESLELESRMVQRYLSFTKPNTAYLFRILKAMERRINRQRREVGRADLIKVCERSTFYTRISNLPDDQKYIAREGAKQARMRFYIVTGRERGFPMQLVEADEWKVDLVVLLKKAKVWEDLDPVEQEAYRKASKRVWISIVADVATTCIIGFRLHERAPSVETALAAFVQTNMDKTKFAIAAGCRRPWDQYGGLNEVRVDSAAWYTSDGFGATISDAGAQIAYPPAANPPLRGTVERMFATISSLSLQNFSGRTFSNVVVRGDRDPRKEAAVDIDRLAQVFVRVIVDIQHETRNNGKLGGMTPRQAWNQFSLQRQIPAPLSGGLLRHVFGVNYIRVIQRDGIRLFGIRYQSEEIQAMRRNDVDREVSIRINLYDLSEITVFDGPYAYTVGAMIGGLKNCDYWTWTMMAVALEIVDAIHTKRTQEQVDEARLWVDSTGDETRMETNLGAPIPTAKHFDSVNRQITRSLEVVEETEYVVAARNQDFSRSSFLAEAWGLSDEPETDDLDVPASEIAKAQAEELARATRKKKPAGPSPTADNGAGRRPAPDDFYDQF